MNSIEAFNYYHIFQNFTEEEKEAYKPRLKRITETFGYRVDERSGMSAALRMYIISKSDRPMEELINLSDMPHDELKRYMDEFLEMMDDSVHPVEECARNLAQVHKTAMQKIKAFRLPKFKLNSIEDLEQYHVMAKVLSTLQTDYTQDMETFRNEGVNRDTGNREKSRAARRAYFEEYSRDEFFKDEQAFGAVASGMANGICKVFTYLEQGSPQPACEMLHYCREIADKFNGKTIGELDLHLGTEGDNIESAITKTDENHALDEEFHKYLNGKTNKYPGVESIDNPENPNAIPNSDGVHRLMERAVNNTPNAFNEMVDEPFRTPNNMLLYPFTEMIPEDFPENLIGLSDEKKQELEPVFRELEYAFHDNIEILYDNNKYTAALESGRDIFDLIKTSDGRSIREIVGNKYDAYSPEQQKTALKYEFFRILKNHPEGLDFHVVHYTDNGRNTEVVNTGSKAIPNKDVINFTFEIHTPEPVSAKDARLATQLTNQRAPQGILDMGAAIYEQLGKSFAPVQKLLRDRGQDIYDYIYIEDKTVNELIAENYRNNPDYNIEIKAEHLYTQLQRNKANIIAAESFFGSKAIYLNLPNLAPDGKIAKNSNKIVPMTFDGTGIIFSAGQKRLGNNAAVINRAREILQKKREDYADPENARRLIYNRAFELASNESKSKEMELFNDRMKRIKLFGKVASPESKVYLDKIYSFMSPLEPELLNICFKIDANRLAASLTNDEQLKAEFIQKAEELTKSPVYQDYENFMLGLEYAYGIKRTPQNVLDVFKDSKLETFFEEKTGMHLLLMPLEAEFRTQSNTRFYRPLEIKLDFTNDEKEDIETAKDILKAVYTAARLGLNAHLNNADSNRIGRRILIDGRVADNFTDADYDNILNNPEAYESYMTKIAEKLVNAAKDGKPVDFYVMADRTDKEELSSVPIRVTANNAKKLSVNTIQANEQLQRNAHNALMTATRHKNQNKEEIARANQYREDHKVEFYNGILRVMAHEGSDFGIVFYGMPMLYKYYPEGVPQPKFDNLKKYDNVKNIGEIRSVRAFPYNYILIRLCEESEQLRKEGKQGYKLDDILSMNGLEDRKRFYADEYKRICDTYDTVEINKNLVSGCKAALNIFYREHPLDRILSDKEERNKAYLGMHSYLLDALRDIYQELEVEGKAASQGFNTSNPKLQMELGLFKSETERNRFINDISGFDRATTSCAKCDIEDRLWAQNPSKGFEPDHNPFYYHVLNDWLLQVMQANVKSGMHYETERLSEYNKYFMADFSNFLNVPAIRNFLSRPDLPQIITEGRIGDYIYVDFDSCTEAIDNDLTFNPAAHVYVLDPANPQLKADVLNASLERSMDRIETFAFGKNFLWETRDLQNLDNEEELARIYDATFGRIYKRTAASQYLREHPGMLDIDMVRIGVRSAGDYFNIPRSAEGVPYTPEQAKHIKAEIVRLLINDPQAPLSYDVIRFDAQKNPQITGSQIIFNPSYMERAILEYPYLKDIYKFKNHEITSGHVANANSITEEEWEYHYNTSLRKAFSNLIPVEQVKSFDDCLPMSMRIAEQDKTFIKLKTLFGDKPVFVTDWAGLFFSTYSREEFNLPNLNKGSFSENDFTTLSFLASLDINNVKANQSLIAEDNPNDGIFTAFEREMQGWTTAFNKDSAPVNLGNHTISDIIAPARKTAESAIEKYDAQGNARDIQPVQTILMNGIKMLLSNARIQENIYEPTSDFAFYSRMLKEANHILDGNQDLKNAVLNTLTDKEKEEFKTILEIEKLAEKKYQAEEAFWKASLKPGSLNYAAMTAEEKEEHYINISRFNAAADKWRDNHIAFKQSEGYRALDAAVEAKLQNVTNDNLKESYKQERTNYLKNHLTIDANLQQSLTNQAAAETASMQNAYRNLAYVKNYLERQINDWNEANAIQKTDENGFYIINEEEFERKCHQMSDSMYRFMNARDLILALVTDADVKAATKKYNENHQDNKLSYNSVADIRNLIPGDNNADLLTEYFGCILEELGKDLGKTLNLKNEIDNIRVPAENAEINPDTLVTHPHNDRINALKAAIPAQDPQRQEKINLLDNINSNLTETKENVVNYFVTYHEMDHRPTAVTQPIEKSMDTHNDGVYSDLSRKYECITGNHKDRNSFINSEKEETIRNLREHPAIPSEDTRTKIVRLIHNMEALEMIPQDGNVQFEQGEKIYGYRKLEDARIDLNNKLNAGNPDQIKTSYEEYIRQKEYVKTIQAQIKQTFPDLNMAPGNVSCERNKNIPVEFTKDTVTDSMFNSLYLLACQAKRSGMTIENFLRNPFKGTEKILNKSIRENNIEKHTENCDNIFAAFNKLYYESIGGLDDPDPGKAIPEFQGNVHALTLYHAPLPGVAFGRPLESLLYLESDPEIRKNMIVDYKAMQNVFEYRVENETYFRTFLYEYSAGVHNKNAETIKRLEEGLKGALLEGTGKISAKTFPVYTANENGVRKEDDFSYQNILNVKDRYNTIIRDYQKNKAAAMNEIAANPEMMKRILEESLFDYLTAHPEDMQKREYRNLESIALRAGKELGIQTSAKADYLQFKEEFRAKITEMQNTLKKEEEAFNKKVKEAQKRIDRILDQYTDTRNHNRPTAELNEKYVSEVRALQNEIDRRILELEQEYRVKNVTNEYLKKRYAQLTELRQRAGEPNFIDYNAYQRIPNLLDPNGNDYTADCKLLADKVHKKEWSGYIKDLATFKHWKMHEDPANAVSTEDELSEEEWENEYRTEIRKYADENIQLPEGILRETEIINRIQEQKQLIQDLHSSEEFVKLVNGGVATTDNNAQGGLDARFTQTRQSLLNGLKNDFENCLKPPMNQPGRLPDGNDEFPGDPYKQDVYKKIAVLITCMIIRSREGKITNGNIDGFATRIATDKDFKRVCQPILKAIHIAKTTEPPSPYADRYVDALIDMVDNKTIQTAYTLQKKNPNTIDGVKHTKNQVKMYTDRFRAEAAANPALNPAANPALNPAGAQAGQNNPNNPQGPAPH